MAILMIKNNLNHTLATPFGPIPPMSVRSFRISGDKARAAAEVLVGRVDGRFEATLEEEQVQNPPSIDRSEEAQQPSLEELTRKELAALYRERFGKPPGRMSKAKLIEVLSS